MKAAPSLLWITDPWETLDHPADTTLRLMQESRALGVRSFWSEGRSLKLIQGSVRLTAREFLACADERDAASFRFKQPTECKPEIFSNIFYRTDPPVDLAYLLPLQMLGLALRKRGEEKAINSISTLFFRNEKMEASALGAIFPRSLVSADAEALVDFALIQIRGKGAVVLKPLFQAQSKGVVILKKSAGLREILSYTSDSFTLPVILQEFLPGILQGEQRLWYVNGKLLACARKKPKSGEAVINMDQGGSVVATKLNAREKVAARRIGAFLKREGIVWAAVDLIDGKATDFNFTSPGLIVQMERVLKRNLAREILTQTLRLKRP